MVEPHPPLVKFLTRLLLRSPLGREDQQRILELPYKIADANPRCDIVSPGETVNHACLVARGLVARFDQMRDGRRQINAFYVPGDMCDLHSVVAPTAAWGISALSRATVLYVPHKDLLDLAHSSFDIAMAFWKDGTADGTILAKWLGNLGRQDARARLAHLLCEMAVRLELAGVGTRTCFQLDASQEQLADALGITPVHVNRTIQGLRQDGLIQTRSRTVEICDWHRLAAAADFLPDYLLLTREKPGFGERVAEPRAAAYQL